MDSDRNIKAQEGDSVFLEELCSSSWEHVYRFIYFKVQNREEAEDITQETFVKAISYLRKSNVKIDNYISFLKAISLNVLRDKWRKHKHHGTNINIEEINPEETATHDHTEATMQRTLIKNALELLNEEQRKVIELRILKGYSVADTAVRMNKNEGNIRVLQYRALQNLSKILHKEGSVTEEYINE
jgi:RNA polymerase sigma-70 factor, ECF subfamily